MSVIKAGLSKLPKGQLISKCLYEIIVWTKIPTKFLIVSALALSGQKLSIFLLVLWSKRRLQKDILKLTDLQCVFTNFRRACILPNSDTTTHQFDILKNGEKYIQNTQANLFSKMLVLLCSTYVLLEILGVISSSSTLCYSFYQQFKSDYS